MDRTKHTVTLPYEDFVTLEKLLEYQRAEIADMSLKLDELRGILYNISMPVGLRLIRLRSILPNFKEGNENT